MILTGETEVQGEKLHTASVADEWISMEHWWNDTDTENLTYWEKFPVILPLCSLQFSQGPTCRLTQFRLCHGTADSEGEGGIHSMFGIKIQCLPLRKQAVKLW